MQIRRVATLGLARIALQEKNPQNQDLILIRLLCILNCPEESSLGCEVVLSL